MTAARKPNPKPDSVTTSARASGECGTTSPRPSVKNVVPLRYRSVTKPGFAPVIITAEPAPYCISPKPKTSPTAHTPTKINSEIGPKKPSNVSRPFLDDTSPMMNFQVVHVAL